MAVYTDQITITDMTDAYSIMLTSESYTFVAATDAGVPADTSCSTQAVAFCGSTQLKVVNVDVDNIDCPDGLTATVKNNGTAAPTITIKTTSVINDACEVIIPITVDDDITVNKQFSIAVAHKGSDGTSITIKSKAVEYQVGTSGTSEPTGNWSTSIPSVPDGRYLWTRTTVVYSDDSKTESFNVSYKAGDGTSITITSQIVEYQACDSGTDEPTGEWSTVIPDIPQGQYLWTRTTVVYSDDSKTESFNVSYIGINGNDGKPAITMNITSSNGTVFKNSTGMTELTAHVYIGGVEQDITDAGVCGSYGSVKWYLGSANTYITTSKKIQVSASSVDGSCVYTAVLE